jgi:hypothetical protein
VLSKVFLRPRHSRFTSLTISTNLIQVIGFLMQGLAVDTILSSLSMDEFILLAQFEQQVFLQIQFLLGSNG